MYKPFIFFLVCLCQGGWGEERLTGYESDMRCDLDQYFANEITGKEIFDNYIARNSPVLIRGLINDWPAIERYKRETLTSEHGDMNVQVGNVCVLRVYNHMCKLILSVSVSR